MLLSHNDSSQEHRPGSALFALEAEEMIFRAARWAQHWLDDFLSHTANDIDLLVILLDEGVSDTYRTLNTPYMTKRHAVVVRLGLERSCRSGFFILNVQWTEFLGPTGRQRRT